jgi:hypothetical protein
MYQKIDLTFKRFLIAVLLSLCFVLLSYAQVETSKTFTSTTNNRCKANKCSDVSSIVVIKIDSLSSVINGQKVFHKPFKPSSEVSSRFVEEAVLEDKKDFKKLSVTYDRSKKKIIAVTLIKAKEDFLVFF